MAEIFTFICSEMAHYGVNAQLVLQQNISAYRISRTAGDALTIAAADAGGLLQGVYALAELAGWSFFQPGRDKFCPELAEKFPVSGVMQAPEAVLAKRGLTVSGTIAPQMVDWMGKNRMNILVWLAPEAPPPEICEAARVRSIEICLHPELFVAEKRCINHTIDESCCRCNRQYAAQLLHRGAGEKLIWEKFLAPAAYAPMPVIHFDELFCEAAFYRQQGAAGVVMPAETGAWERYGMNCFLLARSAAGEEKLALIDRAFQVEYGSNALYARRFFAALKNLLLATGKCLTASPEELYRNCCAGELEELENYLAEWEAPPALSGWVREIKDDFENRSLTK